MNNAENLPEDTYFFEQLRKVRGSLTQDQVNAAKELFVIGYRPQLRRMLGLTDMHSDDKTTSQKGVNFIHSFEGCELTAYKPLKTDVWTIGWGTTVYPNGKRVQQGDKITQAQADEYFKFDLKRFEDTVNEVITVPMTQNLFDALVSLVYNIGIGAFKGGSVDDKINSGDMVGAYATWAKYVNSGGKRIEGLVRRRNAEIAMAQGR